MVEISSVDVKQLLLALVTGELVLLIDEDEEIILESLFNHR